MELKKCITLIGCLWYLPVISSMENCSEMGGVGDWGAVYVNCDNEAHCMNLRPIKPDVQATFGGH